MAVLNNQMVFFTAKRSTCQNPKNRFLITDITVTELDDGKICI